MHSCENNIHIVQRGKKKQQKTEYMDKEMSDGANQATCRFVREERVVGWKVLMEREITFTFISSLLWLCF